MSRLRRNVRANFVGSGLVAVLSVIVIPVYIHFLGIEAYGLLGVLAALQATFGLMDLGLSATLTREMARLGTFPDRHQEMRDVSRTLEVLYWLLALAILLIILVSAPVISRDWLRPGDLSVTQVVRALWTMAALIAIQWPSSLYAGGLAGLQHQVLLNQARPPTALL